MLDDSFTLFVLPLVTIILVDLDISQGLFESIDLVFKDKRYTRVIDYMNVSFHCSHCHDYGHIYEDYTKSFTKKIWRKERV